MPSSVSEIMLFTLSTACNTPLPRYMLLSPSLNSAASWIPVLAPEGTAALPKPPSSVNTSASTVGFPRESNTCLAWMWVISLINVFFGVIFCVWTSIQQTDQTDILNRVAQEMLLGDVELKTLVYLNA